MAAFSSDIITQRIRITLYEYFKLTDTVKTLRASFVIKAVTRSFEIVRSSNLTQNIRTAVGIYTHKQSSTCSELLGRQITVLPNL